MQSTINTYSGNFNLSHTMTAVLMTILHLLFKFLNVSRSSLSLEKKNNNNNVIELFFPFFPKDTRYFKTKLTFRIEFSDATSHKRKNRTLSVNNCLYQNITHLSENEKVFI